MSSMFHKTKVMKQFEEAMLFHGHRESDLVYDIATRRYHIPHIHHMFMGFMLSMHNRENQFRPYVIATIDKGGEITFEQHPVKFTKLGIAREEAMEKAKKDLGKTYAIFGHVKSCKIRK